MPQRDDDTETEGADPPDAPVAARKTYVAPQLRRIGSVRQLTFGSPGGMFADTFGTMKVPPM